MSNNFPAPPGGWALQSVSYSAVLPAPGLAPGSALDFGAGVNGQLTYSVPVLGVVFTFAVPGSFGAFDQAVTEGGLKNAVTGVCTVLEAMSGDPLAGLQAQVVITRAWTWASGASSVITQDTLAYP